MLDTLEGFITWDPIQRARELAILNYTCKNLLDLRCRKSCKKACNELNVTLRQLEDVVETFVIKDIFALKNSFDSTEVSVTDFGKKVLDVANSIM